MAKLSARQIAVRMKRVPGWAKRSRTIWRTFEFKGFMGSVRFVNRVAALAERSDHHPDVDIRWDKVTLALSTHSEGGITEKDFSLARQCNRAFAGKR